MVKDGKNNLKSRREFYIHRIVRNGKMYDEAEEASRATTTTPTKPVEGPLDYDSIGGKKIVSYAETFGYRNDPKRYDAFRSAKKEEIIDEEIQKTKSPVLEEPLEDSEIGYYDEGLVVEPEDNSEFSIDDDLYQSVEEDYEVEDESTETFDQVFPYYNIPLEREDIKSKEREETYYNPVITPTTKKEEAFDELDDEPVSPKTRVEEYNNVVRNTYTPVNETKPTPQIIKKKKKVKYVAPPLDLLTKSDESNADNIAAAEEQKEIINRTFAASNIRAEVASYIFGPTVTQFLIKIEDGANVKDIRKAEPNLVMYLQVEGIRMQTPIPGKPYGGIEVPKTEENRRTVFLGDMISSKNFKQLKYKVPVAVGQDNYGNYSYIDLTEMPHGLIAGTTKSGKSVCLNAFLLSLIYRFTPEELRLVLIDPKRIELGIYEGIPHLAMPVVTDEEDFQSALGWIYDEMERRYKEFELYGERNIVDYNEVRVENKEEKMPYIIVMMDEFSDWFADASSEIEMYMQKLAQKARAAGINILLATQRPSKDVIKGTIKANFDTRIAFRVTSFEDAKVILGNSGAEKLQGYGDMLIRYAGHAEQRLQGAFVPNMDIKKVTRFLKENNECDYMVTKEEIHQSTISRQGSSNGGLSRAAGRNDERFEEVAYFIVRNKNASVNNIQQLFSMGFNRVNDIILALEQMGVLSPAVKGKQREVLVDEFEFTRLLESED